MPPRYMDPHITLFCFATNYANPAQGLSLTVDVAGKTAEDTELWNKKLPHAGTPSGCPGLVPHRFQAPPPAELAILRMSMWLEK